MAQAALAAKAQMDAGDADPAHAGRIALCRFFAENLVGECAALRDRVVSGWASIEAAEAALA